MRFSWVLDYMFGGCWIYRESQPDVRYRKLTGRIIFEVDGEFGGLATSFEDTEILADDWAYACSGHKWEYNTAGTWRGCPICETEEQGDFADVLANIDIVIEHFKLDRLTIEARRDGKKEFLRKWHDIAEAREVAE